MPDFYFISEERAFKRARLHITDAPDEKFKGLYDLFWGKSESTCFCTVSTKIPNERTLSIRGVKDSTFNIVLLPDGLSFPGGDQTMFVPKIYEKFLKLLDDLDVSWQEAQQRKDPILGVSSAYSTVISGQPGIGKHFLFCWCK